MQRLTFSTQAHFWYCMYDFFVDLFCGNKSSSQKKHSSTILKLAKIHGHSRLFEGPVGTLLLICSLAAPHKKQQCNGSEHL